MINLNSPTVIEFIILKWIIIVIGIFIIRLIFRQSFKIVGIAPILTVAFVIAPVNVFIAEIAGLLGMPLNLGAILGLLVFLNAVIIYASSSVVPHLYVENFLVALTISLCLAGFTVLVSHMINSPLVLQNLATAIMMTL